MATIRSKIAFQRSFGGQILATLELTHGFAGDPAEAYTVTAFDDENLLLQQIVLAGLSEEETVELVSKVILTVAGRPYENPWVVVQGTPAQFGILGLRLPGPSTGTGAAITADRSALLRSVDLKVALLQTPVPLCVLEGPEHTITFINEGYRRIMGRGQEEQLLGRPIRVVLHELRGQPFFDWLDRTFQSGEPFVGHEAPARLRSSHTGNVEEFFFDFVYQPLRGEDGRVYGILCQATDVTERVLDKQVREAREAQLYLQWAELDALYRGSPIGMSLTRASDLTIQRINETNASQIGKTVDELLGRSIDELYPNHPFVSRVMRRVIREKTSLNLAVSSDTPADPGAARSWNWSLTPILDARGEVKSIASSILELKDGMTSLYAYIDADAAAEQPVEDR